MATYEKYYDDKGNVAVLVSPGFGAGWTTWNEKFREQLAFDRDLVERVLAGNQAAAGDLAEKKYGESVYAGGAEDLVVKWVPKGEAFEIEEYDGYESLKVTGQQSFMVA